jgi:sorbitol/mannitol transport system substrate-binding protein
LDEARRFVQWNTSQPYIEMVCEEWGWGVVLTGTRISTCKKPAFIEKSGRWSFPEASAIALDISSDSTVTPRPYLGIQFCIGETTGGDLTKSLMGKLTAVDALAAIHASANSEMRKAGYYK